MSGLHRTPMPIKHIAWHTAPYIMINRRPHLSNVMTATKVDIMYVILLMPATSIDTKESKPANRKISGA